MTLDESMTVGHVAATMPRAIRIFESWGIDYCCGGEATLAAACARVGVTLREFEMCLNDGTMAIEEEKIWAAEPLMELTGFIIRRYHEYTREELALIEGLTRKVFDAHGKRHPELADVSLLVKRLTDDLIPHMLKEEQVLFPYIGLLENARATGATAPVPFFGTVRNPVRMMMQEHDAVAEILTTLREVTGAYEVPSDACASYNELYQRLLTLERVTHEHVHMENNILFPRAVEMEGPVEKEFAQAGCCGGSCTSEG
jgi:regulator of cell morphogenesis and NO signaling